MKKKGLWLLAAITTMLAVACSEPGNKKTEDSASKIVDIKCPKFLAFLIEKIDVDKNKDGKVSYDEAAAVTEIVDLNIDEAKYPIIDLTGLEAFVNLKKFHLNTAGDTVPAMLAFPTVDVSALKNLESLIVDSKELTMVKLGKLEKLNNLSLYPRAGKLTKIDVHEAVALTNMDLHPTAAGIMKNVEITRLGKAPQKPTPPTWKVDASAVFVDK